ncbi:hypothetical protein SDC9_51613 [bioreactor metagenome]|uniref:Uncharacterized protein n=1 Tax=bioreactor metagenome TaxID=1076179 RepID=A0A644WN44_9ZZZZ
MAEQPNQSGGDDDSECREQHRLGSDGFGFVPVCAESAIEHDENQRGGANIPRKIKVVERNLQQSVRTKKHAERDEHQQHRYAKLCRNFIEKNTDQNNNSYEQQID